MTLFTPQEIPIAQFLNDHSAIKSKYYQQPAAFLQTASHNPKQMVEENQGRLLNKKSFTVNNTVSTVWVSVVASVCSAVIFWRRRPRISLQLESCANNQSQSVMSLPKESILFSLSVTRKCNFNWHSIYLNVHRLPNNVERDMIRAFPLQSQPTEYGTWQRRWNSMRFCCAWELLPRWKVSHQRSILVFHHQKTGFCCER